MNLEKLNLKKTTLALFLCLSSAALAQNTLDDYLFQNGWTPIPQQETLWVPGMILLVDLGNGQVGHLDPRLTPLQQSLKLDSGSGQFDQSRQATFNTGNAAVGGIGDLFSGISVTGAFQGSSHTSFSGMQFVSLSLATAAPVIAKGSETYVLIRKKYAESRPSFPFHSGYKYGFFLVDEVALATSAHITSDKAISAAGNFGGAADAGTCAAPTLPAALTAAAADTATPAAPAGGQLAATASATAKQNAATTVSGVQNQIDQSKATTPSAKFAFCHSGANEVTFISSQPVPVAMKLRLIESLGEVPTDSMKINDTTTPLPLGMRGRDIKNAARRALNQVS